MIPPHPQQKSDTKIHLMHSIETLFEWLLAASLRASVLALVILGIQFVLRHRLPAVWRHALWLPVLTVLVLPALPVLPATSFTLFPRAAVQPAPVPTSSLPEMSATMALPAPVVNPALAAAATATPVAAEPSATTPSAVQKSFPFAIIWLVGTCVVLAAGFTGYHRNMRRIRMTATPPDRDVQAVIAKAARDAGLADVPHTLISPAVASPAVTGFVRPVLLLPAGFPEGFNAAEARLILLHEFSHLKRLDLPLNWLMCVLQAAHWFNPLLWFAFARMRADREAACDARVLSLDSTDRRAEYGTALIKLQCATPSRAMCLGFVGIFERGAEIQSRIREISAHRQARAIWRVAGGGILTLLMVFGMIQARPAGEASKADAQSLPRQVDDRIPSQAEIIYQQGIEYLAKTQDAGGSWPDATGKEPGVVGLCVAAFLTHGQDSNHGTYAKNIRAGIEYILSQQNAANGYIGNSMYNHGLATKALAEAYGVVDHPKIAEALTKAVELILRAQRRNRFGGWRYTPESTDADASVTGVQIIALIAARNVGIPVPEEAIKQGLSYMASCQNNSEGSFGYTSPRDGKPTLTAIGVLCFTLAKDTDTPAFQNSVEYLRKNLDYRDRHYPYYFEYYMSQALFHADEALWQEWNLRNIAYLAAIQSSDGSFPGNQGPSFNTAGALISLGLNDSFLPIHEQ